MNRNQKFDLVCLLISALCGAFMTGHNLRSLSTGFVRPFS